MRRPRAFARLGSGKSITGLSLVSYLFTSQSLLIPAKILG